MKLLTTYLFLALFFINAAIANAQQDSTAVPANQNLNGQYQFMLSKSKNSYGAKLINPYRLSTLWKSVTDTLNKERKQLKEAKAEIKTQQASIATLKNEISGKETSLANSTAQVNEISFLGISFSKGTYNLIVWSIIAVLIIALLIVVTRSTKNILEAKHRTQLYEEINTEYLAFKAKANEKERKLARELQDERNKWDEQNGR